MDTTNLLNQLINKQDLTAEEARLFLLEVMKRVITPSQIGAILIALRMKGETPEEIVGLIKAMRENMIRVNAKYAIDVCGTGGDSSGTFNISTAVAFVVAGAGVKVVKHGNRAASSKCGSADVLEALGVNLQLSSQQAKEVFNQVGMVFLFAPLFHPALKNLVTVRKELKTRTVFNLLGPFANPASVKKQLIGVPSLEIAEKLAEVGKNLGYDHLLIVTSDDGFDEISVSSTSTLFEVKNKLIKKSVVNPASYGFKKVSKKEIMGGSVEQNAGYIKEILQGRKGSKRDIVILNSAAALYVDDVVVDIKEGIRLAEKSIDSGKAGLVLENLVKETQKYA
ncbi:MAG: anthranilate phosphoribosyltransferase [Candidatus Pacebacteria bacterium CG_4_10_14_3_um_filter_34_15]|nr:MAG: anthranilate phosphoribosyltransferase [Candidatus Pacebacteria bacterium CG11_big_fil_rev_8_21_14_0_20_34_55]PIX81769.1 MAG: anthranilate phosphoribosyltransferase [Candidatus Pacebacteria bacterium CG_4_10_14_3_um_filter_34_15]PJC43462.1 MAG: anthranilate phosphoribosyltransferase [Candidatus Pacebacteria bacterium CG_4_9_14_0_2_um_filter_34_50]